MAMFDLRNIKGDLFGGVTAGVVALPLALAFGVASEMGAIAGLYGAIAIGIVAAIFGGTPTDGARRNSTSLSADRSVMVKDKL